MSQKDKLPRFFEKENIGYGYEAIQDFYLSWTMRSAQLEYENVNIRLHEYAKKMIYALLMGSNNDHLDFILPQAMPADFELLKVTVHRQHFGYIDVVADLEVRLNGEDVRFILNIENKWYGDISEHQLPKAKKAIEDHYKAENVRLLHLVIFCDYEKIKGGVQDNLNKQRCQEHGYTLLTICDLQEFMGIEPKDASSETGNALFDEYWVYL